MDGREEREECRRDSVTADEQTDRWLFRSFEVSELMGKGGGRGEMTKIGGWN